MGTIMTNALIVDDDRSFVPALAEFVRHEGYSVRTADDIHSARAAFHERPTDLVLVDLVLPDGNGLSLVEDLADARTRTKFMIITGYPDVDSAVHAFRGNAVDYFSKPLDIDAFRNRLKGLKAEGIQAWDGAGDQSCLQSGAMIGHSAALAGVYENIARVGPTQASVLLVGESGTGKELAAGAVHDVSRRPGAFVALNCGAISKELIANELFGHERGSYTGATQRHRGIFERAHQGTLFLDEITEMPLETQTHLLRVLETGVVTRLGGAEEVRVDVRIVAATNRDPVQAVADKTLREDLYYRLNVFPIYIPPLREREGDAEVIAQHFLSEFNHGETTSKSFSVSGLAFINSYHWPGNVRELKHCVQRGFILAKHIIDAEHLSPLQRNEIEYTDRDSLRFSVGTPLDVIERRVIQHTLQHCKADKKLAANMLGISLKTLYNKIHLYNAN